MRTTDTRTSDKNRESYRFWTRERCKKEALKYKTRYSFSKNSSGAYSVCCKEKWLDEFCSHMKTKIRKGTGYWTKEKCKKEALKYKTRNNFFKGNRAAYHAAKRNGCFEEVCSHMVSLVKPNGYWTKEKCKKVALNFKRVYELRSAYPGAYNAIWKNGWCSEISKKMPPYGSKEKRLIYAIKFSDRSCYVGLTCDFERRFLQHYKIWIKEKIVVEGLDYDVAKTDYIYSSKEAQIEEKKTVSIYARNGWKILNKVATGSLGGSTLIWTKEMCKNEALKYQVRENFRKNSGGAYNSSRRNGWLDEVCKHMNKSTPRNYWLIDRCKEQAKNFSTREKFKKGAPGAYASALRNGWLDEICKDMKVFEPFWSKKRCAVEAKKCRNRKEFSISASSAYQTARKKGWLDDICKHMLSLRKPTSTWDSLDSCIVEAKKYKTRTGFLKGSRNCHKASIKNGWMEEVCKHMPKRAKKRRMKTQRKNEKE